MKFKIKWGLVLLPALALAMPAFAPAPAYAAPRSTVLSDSQEPGSVLVFPEFIGGHGAAGGPVKVDGVTLPRTEIEIGLVCPPGFAPTTTQCFEHQSFKLRGDWVCPGSQTFESKAICQDTSFEVFITLDGKIAFPADGGTYFFNQPHVQAPQCKNGYLIVWVVDNANRAISFNGLVGDAVIRGPNNLATTTSVVVGSSTAVSAYPAIPIQSPKDPFTLLENTASFELNFDGVMYQEVTGVLIGDVKFDNDTPRTSGPTPTDAFSDTFLIFLTLDVVSGHSNPPIFVPITFWNETKAGAPSTDPNFENPTDTAVEFICWGRFQLTAIDDNLTQLNQGTRKGLFITDQATFGKSPFVSDDDQQPGDNASLLGLVHTVEGTGPNTFQERSYIFVPYNDSNPVFTEFEGVEDD
jgi:hypothetical protein